MAKSDFLSWDCDIDLDALLGEYTEDDIPEVQQKKPKKDPPSEGFQCPICSRVLKTIAGFRGHVTKQHDKPHLKAHQHKLKKSSSEHAENSPTQPSNPLDAHAIENIFQPAFEMSLETIAKDPMHQLFGDSEIIKLCRVIMCLSGAHQFFLDIFTDIFSAGKTLCSTLDREVMFQKFHQTRVSEEFIRGYMLLFATLTFSGQTICDFVNILMMELIGNLISEQVKRGLKNAVVEHDRISDSDQCILFYICGFIARSLRKRYLKVKSVCSQKQKCLDKLVIKSPNSTFVSQFTTWTAKNNRGGLLHPCDEFFLLIREFETLIRQQVDINNLSANSLLCDRLKEGVLEAFMVKHYCEKLFGDMDEHIKEVMLEDILSLFLTIRGYSITRVQRQKIAKNTVPKKKSSGLRRTLKDINS